MERTRGRGKKEEKERKNKWKIVSLASEVDVFFRDLDLDLDLLPLCSSVSFRIIPINRLQSRFFIHSNQPIASSNTRSAATAAPGRPLHTAATAPGAGAGVAALAASPGAHCGSHSCGRTRARR